MGLCPDTQKIRRLYETLDENSDGKLTVTEMNHFLKRLAMDISEEDLKYLVAPVSESEDGSLTFEGFVGLCQCILDNRSEDELNDGDGCDDLMEAFKVYDMNNDGFISSTELQEVLCNLGLMEEEDLGPLLQLLVMAFILQLRGTWPSSFSYGRNMAFISVMGGRLFKATYLILMQVTLQLQPRFKRSIIYLLEGDASLEDNILHFGRNHEFGDLTWYPSQRKVLYRIDDRVCMNVSGDGVNDFIGFRSIPTMLLATARMSEEVQEASQNRMGKCACAEAETMAMVRGGFGLHNRDGEGYGYPVIGFQNMMQASGSCLNSPNDALLTACAWDPRVKGLFFHQTAVAIELSKISEFIKDVKRLGDLRPGSLCGLELYNGILMRFVKGSAGSAYLGAEHDSVAVDMTYYRAREGESLRLDEDVLEEIEQMALFKYGGTPHWGKNRNIAFHGVMEKYSESKYGEFIKAKHKYDPEGLFSNDWTDALLQIGNSSVVLDKDACALEGLCLCREDRHCAPEKGYFCRPGIVFADARVCRYIGPRP